MLLRVECIHKLAILSTEIDFMIQFAHTVCKLRHPSPLLSFSKLLKMSTITCIHQTCKIKSWSRTTQVWYTSCGSSVVVLKPVVMISCSAVIVLERMLLEVLRSWGSSDCIVCVTTAVEALSLAVRAAAWANTSSRVALLPKILSACNRYRICNSAWAWSAKELYTYAWLN